MLVSRYRHEFEHVKHSWSQLTVMQDRVLKVVESSCPNFIFFLLGVGGGTDVCLLSSFPSNVCMMLISGSYLVCFCARAWSGNLSWQNVYSLTWIVSGGEGDNGVCIWFGLLLCIGCLVLVLLGIGILRVYMCI